MTASPLRRLLIVSPHFPPVNAPDMQRVRMALPYCREFGWDPSVLTVDAASQEATLDPALNHTIPPDVPVTSTPAFSARWTRTVGIGNVALRAFAHLYRAGGRLLQSGPVDLVFFSTTMFAAMALGPLWKKRFGVPFVIDMQDPWLSTYLEERADVPRPPKYRAARALDSVLEPFTMRAVDGVIAVSEAYIETLRRRYSRLERCPAMTLPFGAAPADFDRLAEMDLPNPIFQPGDGTRHVVYVGRGGHDMAPALRVLFGALAAIRRERTDLAGHLRLHFVGTDYAPAGRGVKTVQPIADACGVGDMVDESPARVPYFEALKLIRDADLTLVVGSDDPQYTASKVYPYVLARRPLVAVVHEASSVGPFLRETGAGSVVTFSDPHGLDVPTMAAKTLLTDVLARLPYTPDTNWVAFEPATARAMTRRMCEFFDRVLVRETA